MDMLTDDPAADQEATATEGLEEKSSIDSQSNLFEKLKKILESSECDQISLTGNCPDLSCMTQLFFTSKDDLVSCHNCLQDHKKENLLNRYEVGDKDVHSHQIYRFGSDFVKVDGLSNFCCKLLSPLLTKYGMNKAGSAVLLKDLGHAETIDCGKVLGSRSFAISSNHIDIVGYGKDRSGSLDYLAELLSFLKDCHNGEERLVPIHVDGDGHCLVHALSRALTGRELFWHSLRQNLYDHLKQSLPQYRGMFQDFHSTEEWERIIAEADPDCTSNEGLTLGLGNIHIFALSNILKRPIMLLNTPKKMQSRGDYCGLFVPVFVEPDQCTNKSPICIAWSGAAHNHFIPLVPLEGRPLPTIPRACIPELWGGVHDDVGRKYLEYDQDGSLTVSGGKPISISYLQKLTSAMENVFKQRHVVAPALFEDVCRYVYNLNETPGLQAKDLVSVAANAALENRLYRCLMCKSLCQVDIDEDSLKHGGRLYNLAVACHQHLVTEKMYYFPEDNIKCIYLPTADKLAPLCAFCHQCGSRRVDVHDAIEYVNGDRVDRGKSAGSKVFWDGREYDNAPVSFFLKLNVNGQEIEESVLWFYGDSNPDLNSNVAVEAKKITQKHFPGHSDSEEVLNKLVQQLNEHCEKHRRDNAKDTTGAIAVSSSSSAKPPRDQLVAPSKEIAPKQADSALPVHESAPTAQSSLACKRKLNGDPIDAGTIVSKQKEQSVVKISLLKGETRTVRLDPNIDLTGLQNLIQELFGIDPDRQILKQGFPPRVIKAPSDGGSLLLKSGDKITVDVKRKLPEESKPDAGGQTTGASLSPLSDLGAKRKALKDDFANSNCSSLWEYAMGRPELFCAGGYFHEQFKTDIGLKDGQHCRLPLLGELGFLYNAEHDRVELCLEPLMGHYPINDEVRRHHRIYLDRRRAQDLPASNCGDPSAAPPRPEGDSTPTSAEPKSGNLAPGYHTVGGKPTELTESEKLDQRESLLKMVEHVKSKQSSS